MNIKIMRGSADKHAKILAKRLERYLALHPDARILLHRPPERMIHIYITDGSFKGVQQTKRDKAIWLLLEDLPLDTVNEIGMLILHTPEEAKEWPMPDKAKKRRSTSV